MLLQEPVPSAALGRISSPRCICERVTPNLRGALRWKGGQNLDNHHSPAWEPAQPQARPQPCPMGLRDLSQLICPTDLHPTASAPPGHPHFPLPFGMCCSMSCSCHHSPLFWEPRGAPASPSTHGCGTHPPHLATESKSILWGWMPKQDNYPKMQETASTSRNITDSLFFSA